MSAIPRTRTWVANEVLHAADLIAHINSPIDALSGDSGSIQIRNVLSFPTYTASQLNALSDVQTGSVAYSTTTSGLVVYDGATWQSIGGGGTVTTAQIAAVVADWAEAGDSSLIPDTKLSSNIARSSDIPSNATIDQRADARAAARYTDDEKNKLAGIETGATADQTGTEIIDAIDGEIGSSWQTGGGSSSGGLTPAQLAKLNGIEAGATADQTPAEIRDDLQSLTGDDRLDASAVKNLPQPGDGGLSSVATDATLTGLGTSGSALSVANPFTDADEAKLDGIQAGAQVNVGVEFSQADSDKLDNIQNNATDDQTAVEIRDSLESLTGEDRLPASAVKDISTGGTITGNADTVDNLHLWEGTQTEYDAVDPKLDNTIYFTPDPGEQAHGTGISTRLIDRTTKSTSFGNVYIDAGPSWSPDNYDWWMVIDFNGRVQVINDQLYRERTSGTESDIFLDVAGPSGQRYRIGKAITQVGAGRLVDDILIKRETSGDAYTSWGGFELYGIRGGGVRLVTANQASTIDIGPESAKTTGDSIFGAHHDHVHALKLMAHFFFDAQERLNFRAMGRIYDSNDTYLLGEVVLGTANRYADAYVAWDATRANANAPDPFNLNSGWWCLTSSPAYDDTDPNTDETIARDFRQGQTARIGSNVYWTAIGGNYRPDSIPTRTGDGGAFVNLTDGESAVRAFVNNNSLTSFETAFEHFYQELEIDELLGLSTIRADDDGKFLRVNVAPDLTVTTSLETVDTTLTEEHFDGTMEQDTEGKWGVARPYPGIDDYQFADNHQLFAYNMSTYEGTDWRAFGTEAVMFDSTNLATATQVKMILTSSADRSEIQVGRTMEFRTSTGVFFRGRISARIGLRFNSAAGDATAPPNAVEIHFNAITRTLANLPQTIPNTGVHIFIDVKDVITNKILSLFDDIVTGGRIDQYQLPAKGGGSAAARGQLTSLTWTTTELETISGWAAPGTHDHMRAFLSDPADWDVVDERYDSSTGLTIRVRNERNNNRTFASTNIVTLAIQRGRDSSDVMGGDVMGGSANPNAGTVSQPVFWFGRFGTDDLVGGLPPAPMGGYVPNVGPARVDANDPWYENFSLVPDGVDQLYMAQSIAVWDGSQYVVETPFLFTSIGPTVYYAFDINGLGASIEAPDGWTYFAFRLHTGELSGWIPRNQGPRREQLLGVIANSYRHAYALGTYYNRTFNLDDYDDILVRMLFYNGNYANVKMIREARIDASLVSVEDANVTAFSTSASGRQVQGLRFQATAEGSDLSVVTRQHGLSSINNTPGIPGESGAMIDFIVRGISGSSDNRVGSYYLMDNGFPRVEGARWEIWGIGGG